MLAFTDSGLAYLTLAAGRLPVHARGRWLKKVAAKLDPPPSVLARADEVIE